MPEKSILIVGAGVAGLCTGIYAQKNGYKSTIVEKYKIPGGLMTAWGRKGYLIDVCVHWLTGSGPGIYLHRYWNEVGLLEGKKFLQHESYGVYHAKDGRSVHLYCDPEKLEKHLLELAPEDKSAIQEFVDGVRFGIAFQTPPKEQYEASPWEWMKFIMGMMPRVKEIQKWTKLTVQELADRFTSPLLREALTTLWIPDGSVLFVLTTLGFMYKKFAGYPLGGSLPLALGLENKYKHLGGTVMYEREVERILVEKGKAVGVQLKDGSTLRADVVISAADGNATIHKLLGGKFTDKKIEERYKTWKAMPGMVYIGVGVKRTFEDVPFAVEGNSYELQRPVMIAGEEQKSLGVRVHNHEPGFAPKGKIMLTSAIFSNYESWKTLANDKAAYEAEKEKVGKAYLEALEQIWPGISAQVEMMDISTPVTFERYTGNWRGSITGWKLTPEQGMAKISKTLPGLGSFWMVGQWVNPGGGLPAGVATGREVIWRQCKLDKKMFAGG